MKNTDKFKRFLAAERISCTPTATTPLKLNRCSQQQKEEVNTMGKLREFMEKRTQISPLATGKKLETADILGTQLTINDFDFIDGKDGQYAVVHFAEIENAFYFTGMVLTDILRDIAADEDLTAELKSDGLKIMLTREKAKSGNYYTKVNVV